MKLTDYGFSYRRMPVDFGDSPEHLRLDTHTLFEDARFYAERKLMADYELRYNARYFAEINVCYGKVYAGSVHIESEADLARALDRYIEIWDWVPNRLAKFSASDRIDRR